MSKIEQNRQRRRQSILEAARDVFLSRGYVAAGMDEIAARAHVTKQTVYRYFGSKIDLFQATLKHIGEHAGEDFSHHLETPDTGRALHGFACAFIKAHLSDGHLKTYRLLATENAVAPEITPAFFTIGPETTRARLTRFFADRLGVSDPDTTVRLWTAMLLAFRNDVLVGGRQPSEREIVDHARAATALVLTTARLIPPDTEADRSQETDTDDACAAGDAGCVTGK